MFLNASRKLTKRWILLLTYLQLNVDVHVRVGAKIWCVNKVKITMQTFFHFYSFEIYLFTMIYDDFRNQSFSWQLLSKSTCHGIFISNSNSTFIAEITFFFTFITTSLQAKHLGYINFTENKLQKCYLQFTLIQNTAILSNYWMALSMISTDY